MKNESIDLLLDSFASVTYNRKNDTPLAKFSTLSSPLKNVLPTAEFVGTFQILDSVSEDNV